MSDEERLQILAVIKRIEEKVDLLIELLMAEDPTFGDSFESVTLN